MLSILRKIVGCWHHWSRWSDAPIIGEFGEQGMGQKRVCSKCGKSALRYAG